MYGVSGDSPKSAAPHPTVEAQTYHYFSCGQKLQFTAPWRVVRGGNLTAQILGYMFPTPHAVHENNTG